MAPLDLPANWKLAAAILCGGITGFMLFATALCRRKTILDLLALKDRKVLNIVLYWLLSGIVIFFVARRTGLVEVRIGGAEFWPTLLGGILCGAGLVIAAFTPTTALAALGTGRIYSLWALLGMILAIPCAPFWQGLVARTVGRLGEPMSLSAATPGRFWDAGNPALYLVLALAGFTVWSSLGRRGASGD